MKKKILLLIAVLAIGLLFVNANPLEILETFAVPDAPNESEPQDADPDPDAPAVALDQPADAPAEEEMDIPQEPELPEIDFVNDSVDELVDRLSYMETPIEGRSVTSVNGQLPNAPRNYRNGVHEGLDYYNTIGRDVLAAGPGTVIRADHGYVEMTLEEYEDVIRRSITANGTPPELLDKLRGMQVWIEHPDGVVTRYAHLKEIRPEITEGTIVETGQAIATVGNTGMRANVTGVIESPSGEPHLHFEIWQGNTFLGQGRSPDTVRRLYSRILN
ncbi:M23 family metallopeptidase [Dethiobacter alkaliphilus]|uniref:M23 family metallopeptidase n=1 Tax=Dethiobacter alkaliphilus TaxID=427926 RepID=UPI002225DB2F|nr:M23 family metallopeptidase [Dethiobacter alkaliphilus]MCW3490348.1 M23 family metallopeptidase [Dethiobacter alkaliphilus]